MPFVMHFAVDALADALIVGLVDDALGAELHALAFELEALAERPGCLSGASRGSRSATCAECELGQLRDTQWAPTR